MVGRDGGAMGAITVPDALQGEDAGRVGGRVVARELVGKGEDGGGDGGQVGGEWCEGGDYGEGAVGEGVLVRGVGVRVRVGDAVPCAAVAVWHGAYIALCEGGLTEYDLEYGVALVL